MPANASSKIIGAGIIPGGMEMMDRPAIHAVEEFVHAGYPLDVEALLIVELDGPRGGGRPSDRTGRSDRRSPAARRRRENPVRKRSGCCSGPGARRRFPQWAAFRRITMCMDGTIPRGKLPYVLSRMRELSKHIRSARRQCVPCRRRQPSSADPLRCQQAGRTRTRGGVRRAISFGYASRSAACSPANMASASKSAT